MDYVPSLIATFGAFLLAAGSPGANVMAVAGASLRAGRFAGLSVALGVTAGSLIWASLAVFGITALLSTFAQTGLVIGVLGGAYLCWLGAKALRSAKQISKLSASEEAERPRFVSGLLKGVLVQLTNPKVILFWIAIMSLVVDPEAPNWVGIVLIGGITCLSFVLRCGYALAFSSRPAQRAYEKAGRWIEALQGVTFIGLGGYLVIGAFGR
jgi:RhtB (resistance to homoserine/threonine) family protein